MPIELDPNNIRAWISKANALTELGNEEEAKACVEKVKAILSFATVRTIDPSYSLLSSS